MIAFVKGVVDEVGEDFVIIDTGYGLGYEISLAPDSDLLQSMKKGKEVKMYTSQYFRENDQGLYGFASIMQRNFYELLVTVSGVGPKLASTLLAHIPSADLANMIVNNDVESMKEVPGIGQKMAERIILDLRDKILGEGFMSNVSDKSGDKDSSKSDKVVKQDDFKQEKQFLEEALQKLGFGQSEIKNMQSKADKLLAEGQGIEDVLKELLGGRDSQNNPINI
jgi:Holliday junction DNA helicase RuvA